MPTFGPYESVGELYPSASGAVHAVRPADAGAGAAPGFELAAKTFRAPPGLPPADARRRVASFLARAEIQRAAAAYDAAGASAWAPILDAGETSDGAYYVTRRYPRSVQTLFDGSVSLPPRALHAVATAVATGLRQLAASAGGRPHGNLKPSNILIAGEAEIVGQHIALTDPAPAERLGGGAGTESDLRDLGEILFQLATGLESRGPADFRGRPAREWRRLGSAARPWHDLLARLVAPGPGQALTLDQLLEHLGRIREVGLARYKRPALYAGAAAAVALAAGGAVYIYLDRQVRKPWQELCAIYSDIRIFENGSVLEWREAAPGLHATPEEIADHDPAKLASGVPTNRLIFNPPHRFGAKEEVAARLEFARGVKRDFDAWAKPVTDAADALRRQGCADAADALWSGFTSSHSAVSFVDFRAQAELLRADLGRLDENVKALAAANDPALAAYADYASSALQKYGTGQAAELRQAVAALTKESGGLRDALRADFASPADHAQFVQFWTGEAGPASKPVPERFVSWRAVADKWKEDSDALRDHDPRPALDAIVARPADRWQFQDVADVGQRGRFEAERAELVRRIDGLKAQPLNPYTAGECAKAQAQAADLLLRVDKVISDQKLAKARADEEEIAAKAAKDKADEEARQRQLAEATRLREAEEKQQRQLADEQRHKEELASARAAKFAQVRNDAFAPAAGAVKAEWVALRDALGQDKSPTDDPEKALAKLEVAKRNARAIEGDKGLAEGPSIPALFAGSRAAFDAYVSTCREAAYAGAAKEMREANPSRFEEHLSAVRRDYQAKVAALTSLADACDRAVTLVRGGGLPDAAASALLGRIARHEGPPLDDPKLLAAFKDATREVAAVAAVAAGTDRNKLAGRLADPSLLVRLAAYVRLGDVPGWPATADELKTDADARGKLLAEIKLPIRDAARAAVQTAGPKRWAAFVKARASAAPDNWKVAAAFVQGMGVEEKGLDPVVRYNLALARAKADVAAKPADASKLREHETRLRDLAGTLSGRKDAGDLLAKLKPSGTMAALTPGALPQPRGWSQPRIEQDGAVVYTLDQNSIRFRPIASMSGTYLSETEVSIGLFIDWLDARLAGSLKVEVWKAKRASIVGWKFEHGYARCADTWIDTSSGDVDAICKVNFPDPAGKPGAPFLKPGRNDPVQNIPPALALGWARSLGFRFPTEAEWKAANDQCQATAGGGRVRWNRRDKRWYGECQRLAKIVAPDPAARLVANFLFNNVFGDKVGDLRAFEAVTDVDDGWIWFAPVDAQDGPPPFKHLIGNVAEFVTDVPMAGSDAGPISPTLDGIEKELGDHARVIGGSALSPKSVDPMTAYPVAPTPDAKPYRYPGYADVGFRLAFSAPGGGVPQQPAGPGLAQVIAEAKYEDVTPAAPAGR